MDHDAVRAALELAAVEPGGLDRLMAGDTPEAQAVAGHIAGCEACAAELGRIGRVSAVVRASMADVPSPDLKERTLAFVREKGVPRGAAEAPAAAVPAAAAVAGSPPITSIAPAATAMPVPSSGGARPSVLGWVFAIAAAVVLSVTATTLIVGSRVDERLAAQDQALEDLAAVTTATIQVASEPDAERVALSSPSGTATTGTLLYSPSSTDTVVVATGLSEPTDGSEYHCWVEVDGARKPVGKMFFGGGIAYWVGPAPAVSGLSGTETFGVSLVGTDGELATPDPVLVGTS
jgi:anti-sigma factor RsiW